MGACGSSSAAASDVDVTLQTHRQGITCEALFFPDPALPCRSYLNGKALCKRPHCQFAHEHTSLVRLLQVLGGASRTLDVCVFTITCNEIADAIESAAKRKVAVRIITDDEQVKSQGSDVAKLSKVANVQVRHDGDAKSLMHHKFAIIDGQTLINGSFNWTRAACITNHENIVITTHAPALITSFQDEFNKLWQQFASNTRLPR